MRRIIIAAICLMFAAVLIMPAEAADKLLVDEFDGTTNALGGRTNVYQQAPSRAMFRKTQMDINGNEENVLMIKYDKRSTDGPYGKGGWCGYYTLLGIGDETVDVSDYDTLTMWVKGKDGTEDFKVGLADSHWQQIGDSVKSEAIGNYLPAGEITTEWQKAEIPLDVYMLDLSDMASIAINFEADLYGNDDARGTIYIDEIAFE